MADDRKRFNPHHRPAGSPQGGEFAPKPMGNRNPATGQKLWYPTRTGNSIAAFKKHIVDAIDWTYNEYGPVGYDGKPRRLDYDRTGPFAVKAAEQLKAEGVIDYEIEHELLTGQPAYAAFGRHIGWGESKTYTHLWVWRV